MSQEDSKTKANHFLVYENVFSYPLGVLATSEFFIKGVQGGGKLG